MARILPESEWTSAAKWANPLEPHLYVIQEGDVGPVKVGFSRNAFWRRVSLNAGNYRRLHLRLVWICSGRSEALLMEASILRHFDAYRLGGEWLDLSVDEVRRYVTQELGGHDAA